MWSLWCLLTQLGSQFNYVNSLMSHYAVKPMVPEALLLSPDTNFHGTHRNLNISDSAVIMPPSASSFKKHLARGRLGR